MGQDSDFRLVRRFNILSALAGVFSVLVGLSGLLGSALQIRWLTTWFVEPVTMKANTAACFLAAGGSLWVLTKPRSVAWNRIGRGLAALVPIVGVLSWWEYFFGVDLGIDQWLVRSLAGPSTMPHHPGLMSPITALTFVAAGAALVSLDWRTKSNLWPSQVFSVLAALGASFGALNLLFQPGRDDISLALPTAVTFFLLSAGTLCSRPEWAFSGLLASPSEGARWFRRSLAGGLLVLISFGTVLSKPLLTTAHFTWLETTAIAVCAGVLLMSFIGWTSVLLDRSERQRKRVEQALQLPPEKLDLLLDRYDESPTEMGLRRWSIAGIGVGLILAVLGGYDSLHSIRQTSGNDDWVAHSHAVDAALELILSDMLDIEAGARSFAATGDAVFLEPARKAQAAIDGDLDDLRSLTADNATQRKRLEILRPLVEKRIAGGQAAISYRQRTGRVPPTEMFLQGKQLMDAVRRTTDEMRAAEAKLLEQRIRAQTASRERTGAVTLISTLIGIVMLVFAGLVVMREASRVSRMHAQIMALNAELERRVVERTVELHESGERLQGIIDSAMDAIVTVDEEQRIVLFNPAAETIFRCPQNAAIGEPLNKFIPQRFRASHSAALREFGISGTRRRMGDLGYVCGLRADGEEFPMEASISHTEIGGRSLSTAIARDITERKQAETALRESEQRFQAMVNGIPQLAWMAEADGHIFWYNQRWFEYSGTTVEQMAGWGWHSAHDPETLPKVLERWKFCIREGAAFDMETALRGADGIFRMFLTRVVPLKDSEGHVVRWFGTHTDISALKQAEAEVHRLNEELEKRVEQRTAELQAANQEMEAFTYSVSHDLRAPLRHISGFSKMLSEDFKSALPAEAQHYVERISDGTRRMGLLVDDLLNLGRIGRQELRLQVTGLRSLVDEIISELAPECAGRRVEWKIGDLPFMDCDPGLFKQVLQNLLANALKFTRPRSPAVIEIGQQERDGTPVVYVRDNGVGFSMKYSDKLFGVFQRLHRQEDFEGTGVGLAIVQRIIKKHGGCIWAEAELDKGATFYFTAAASDKNSIARSVSMGGAS